MSKTNTAGRVLDVLAALMKQGLTGAAIEAIADDCGLLYPSTRRALHALKERGWAKEETIPGTNRQIWRAGATVVRVAHEYRREALRARHDLEQTFLKETGEELTSE